MNKKLIAGISTAVLAGGLIGHVATPAEEVVVEKTITEYVDRVVIEKDVVEVPVNVTEYVEVDNGNLELVLDHIYDNNGDIEYIVDDLDDDELEYVVDRIVFVNEIKKLAVDAVESELFDELDGETFNVTEFDEDDMERLRIDDDEDEVVVDEVDFEDGDATVIVTGRFDQDDERYNFEVEVKFKDGEFDELDNIVVSQ